MVRLYTDECPQLRAVFKYLDHSSFLSLHSKQHQYAKVDVELSFSHPLDEDDCHVTLVKNATSLLYTFSAHLEVTLQWITMSGENMKLVVHLVLYALDGE